MTQDAFTTKRLRYTLVSLVYLMAFAGCHSSPRKTTIIISSAASLKDAMTEIEAKYGETHPDILVENNFAASGTLALQIEHSAPVDLFISAASKQMDEVERMNLLAAHSRKDLLKNNLVLVAPKDSSLSGFDGLTGPAVRVIAIGDPASVPAGQYGRQTLLSLGLHR